MDRIPERQERKLPLILDRTGTGYSIYDPEKGVRGAQIQREGQNAIAIQKWLETHTDRVEGRQLKPGDWAYVEHAYYHQEDLGPNSSVSGHRSRHYLHEIVEEDGRTWLKVLTRTPAAPAASQVWLEPGRLIPIPDEPCFRVKNQKQSG